MRNADTTSLPSRVLLGPADALRDQLAADQHFDVKHLAVLGAGFAGDAVDRQRPAEAPAAASCSRDL